MKPISKTYLNSKKLISYLFVVFFTLQIFIQGVYATSSQVASTANTSKSTASNAASVTPGVQENPILKYKLNVTSESALVFEVGRGMRLYLKNQDANTQIPMASKIMTALIAIESIPADTKITISTIAAKQSDASALSLKTGEKYSLDYLLYGLILKNNNAAAIALAEQVSGTEENFVTLMNDKTKIYQMDNTVFKNATGIYDEKQISTLTDVSRLVRFAISVPKFETIISTKDIPFFLSTNQTKHIISNLDNVWSLVENTTGAFLSESKSHVSYMSTAKYGNVSIVIIGKTASKSKITNDLSTITESIFRDYEFSTLVNEGQSFPKTITVGSNSFGLSFNNTINYIHPKGIDFIKFTNYEENELIEYPILTTKSVAKVTFELLDGTSISADLFPDKTYWGESDLYLKIMALYEANKDIGNLLIILTASFLILGLYNLFKGIFNYAKRTFHRKHDV